MRATADMLVERVGAKLDIEIGSNTVPSYDQVSQWLQDGANELVGLLPEPMLAGFMVTETYSGATSPISLDFDTCKILRVSWNDFPARQVPMAELYFMRAIGGSKPIQAVWSLNGVGGDEAIQFWPDGYGHDVVVEYVTWPADVSLWGSEPEEPFCPPQTWEPAIVDYAVFQGRMQDEELGLAQVPAQTWAQKVQIWSKTGEYPVSVEAS